MIIVQFEWYLTWNVRLNFFNNKSIWAEYKRYFFVPINFKNIFVIMFSLETYCCQFGVNFSYCNNNNVTLVFIFDPLYTTFYFWPIINLHFKLNKYSKMKLIIRTHVLEKFIVQNFVWRHSIICRWSSCHLLSCYYSFGGYLLSELLEL